MQPRLKALHPKNMDTIVESNAFSI